MIMTNTREENYIRRGLGRTDFMFLKCCNCSKVLLDDILESVTIDCSTNINNFKESTPNTVLEIKCRRCGMYNTIYQGGVADVKI
jgi:hypothetical protein